MMEPVAYAAFADNGHIRMWSQAPGRIDATAAVDNFKVEPLVRLSDAEARIAELEAENAALAAHACVFLDGSGVTGDEHGNSVCMLSRRLEAAEALLKEVQTALVPFALRCHETRNTHLLDWLPEGYDHCRLGSKDWAQSYLNSAKDYIKAFESAARAIHHKIGVKDE